MLKSILKGAGFAALGYVLGMVILIVVGFITGIVAYMIGMDPMDMGVTVGLFTWWVPYVTLITGLVFGLRK